MGGSLHDKEAPPAIVNTRPHTQTHTERERERERESNGSEIPRKTGQWSKQSRLSGAGSLLSRNWRGRKTEHYFFGESSVNLRRVFSAI